MGKNKSATLFCTFGLLEVVCKAFSSHDNGSSWYCSPQKCCTQSGGGFLQPPHQKEGTFNLNLEQFSSTKALCILESKGICKSSGTVWASKDIVPP